MKRLIYILLKEMDDNLLTASDNKMETLTMKKKSKRKWQKSLLIFAFSLLLQGCFLFGAGNDTSDPPDVCEGKFNTVVKQDKDGIGVTRARCQDSPRGTWLEDGGGCYCRGQDDG